MKILKRILLFIVFLIAVVLIGALFAPKEFGGESQVVINQSDKVVYNYIKYLKNQENYGTWYQMDPNMKTSEEGTDGTVGYTYKWDSEKFMVGKGKQVISNLVEGEKMESDLYFDGFDEAAKSVISITSQAPDKTLVKWSVKGNSPYPWNFMNLFFDMDKDFKEGLANLKNILEK
jgi:hypothetical protein